MIYNNIAGNDNANNGVCGSAGYSSDNNERRKHFHASYHGCRKLWSKLPLQLTKYYHSFGSDVQDSIAL